MENELKERCIEVMDDLLNIKDNIKTTELLRKLLFAAPLDTMPTEYLALLYKCADSEVDDAFRLRITAEIERRYNDKT